MSEFTNTKKKRIERLKGVSKLLLETGNAHAFITENKEFIPKVVPTDFITLFDEIIKEGYKMEDVKMLSNKVLNIFHITIRDYPRIEPKPDSFLGVLEQNNREMVLLLDKIRPVYKSFIKAPDDKNLATELYALLVKLEVFAKHYTIKENVLFPIIEKTWEDYRCLKIMWSFHDDIRRNIKTVREQLSNSKIDLKSFNKCIGEIFFNMLAIKFREEHILFPYIISTISEGELETMNREGFEIGYPYIKPPTLMFKKEDESLEINLANLGTGILNIDQIKLIFNHLPVDITYVDENDRVLYFSTPPKRIFPRTVAIIGREVSNCHPPESVHVVEKIIESFRNGEKDKADFWIKMRGEFILIQYFAVRDERKNYKGVIEVSQEISEIRALEGEKRLLDW
ncbi:MAG: PAS domain-containing protein [Bacteroidales bacterium]|nr:PAS domain-containing protein [Bacteroidales bacterium]